jgi:hypothetical protein
MRFALFKYGSGVLYGHATNLDTVDPETGPSPGGNAFILTGEGFDPRQWDDLFEGATLDTVKWLDISSGSGAVATGAFHLELATGVTPGSASGIESTASWGDTQGEIRLQVPPINAYPSDVVTLTALQLYVDASNYAQIRLELGTSPGTLLLHCEVYRSGSLNDKMIVPLEWTSGLSMLKILRWDTDLYFYANGAEIFHSFQFVNTAAKFRVFMDNLTTDYDLQGIRVQWFYYRPFAVFQNQPVHDSIVVSDFRMRGIVPASRDDKWKAAAYEGIVHTHVVGNGTRTKRASYEYYYVEGLRVINSSQTDTQLDFIDDAQLFTPTGEQKGLGGGQ